MRMRSITSRILFAGGLSTLLGSCAEYKDIAAPGPGPPAATSPVSAVRLFEWAVSHSHPELLDAVFSGRCGLLSGAIDSAGNPASSLLPRDSVLAGFRAMLEGVP